MTVAENIGFPLRCAGIARDEIARRVERVLDMVQLAGFGGRRPAQLSGGQQQRVAVARALVFEPKLVLMDEPLGALDKQLREQMQLEIRRLHQRLGVTIVYVTHDQARGADDVRPHRGLPSRQDPAARPAGAALRDARQRLRRPLHRREQPLRGHPAVGRRASGARCGSPATRASRARWRRRCPPAAGVTVSLRPERVQIGEPGHTIPQLPVLASRGRCAKSSISAITSGRGSRCLATTISP